MLLPLYGQTIINWEALFNEAQTAHIGLLFDKFPHGTGWADEAKHYQPADNVKKDFFVKIIDKYNQNTNEDKKPIKNTPLNNHLAKALSQQSQLLDYLNGQQIEVATDWRFVSGLGASHPFETGFIWHRTLSVPYMPGSSVKGLMRAWASQWGGLEEQSEIDRLFGPEQKKPETPAEGGAIIVLDALPATVPELELDILNPHYSEYYQNPKDNPPADYLSPKPVFFISVAPQQHFKFYIAPRSAYYRTAANKKFDAKQDLDKAKALLEEALANLGAGGKTAVGYGVFAENEKLKKVREAKEAAQREQQEQANKAAEHQAILEQRGYHGLAKELYLQSIEQNWKDKENNSTLFYKAMDNELPRIENETDPEIKAQAIAVIKDIMEARDKGIMVNPEKRKGKKGEDFFYKENPRKIALLLLAIKP